jgi:hypothetical protein
VTQEEALRELAEDGVMKERGKELARLAAKEALQALKDGKKLTEMFKAPDAMGLGAPGIDGLPVDGEIGATVTEKKGPELRVTGLFARERPIPGLGMNEELTRAAWAADPKAEFIDGVFEIEDGLVIAAVGEEGDRDGGGSGGAARAGLYRELVARKPGG